MSTLRDFWKLYLAEGIIFIILGLLALGSPYLVTISLNYLLGALLLLGGVAQGVRAFQSSEAPGFGASLVGAILSVIVGGLLLAHPYLGAITIAMLLALFFLFEGISKIAYAIEYRKSTHWVWILFSGVISLILAGLIWSEWPQSGLVVLGIYVGAYLLVAGFSLVFLAFAVKE